MAKKITAKKTKGSEDLRAKTADELKARVLELTKESFNLRFQQTNGQLKDTSRCRKVRREIAQIKTILDEKNTGKEK